MPHTENAIRRARSSAGLQGDGDEYVQHPLRQRGGVLRLWDAGAGGGSDLAGGRLFNVISFLESRPRNTTAVALENTIVSEITYDNFSAYFREKPAKIMSLLQHMSARMRQMQKAYVDTCHALEVYGDKAKLAAEHGRVDRQPQPDVQPAEGHVPVRIPRGREIDTHPRLLAGGIFFTVILFADTGCGNWKIRYTEGERDTRRALRRAREKGANG